VRNKYIEVHYSYMNRNCW